MYVLKDSAIKTDAFTILFIYRKHLMLCILIFLKTKTKNTTQEKAYSKTTGFKISSSIKIHNTNK